MPLEKGDVCGITQSGRCWYGDLMERSVNAIVSDPPLLDGYEDFANFYEVSGGSIDDGMVFRSYDRYEGPATDLGPAYVDTTMKENRMSPIISSGTSREQIE